MSTATKATPLTLLAGLLLERAGLRIGPESHYGLRLATAARLEALGLSSISEYVERLRGPGGEDELRALMPLVTVGHTEFFRDPRQFAALERRVLSELLMRARKEGRKLCIWSAGCATGEEPYSVAMLLHELGALPDEVDVWATDVNPAAVEAAKEGQYTHRRVSTLAAARRQRYFEDLGERVRVLPILKRFVRFDIQNLASTTFPDVLPGSLDLVLCRNVIIYFDLPTIRALMDRFLQALRPGGLLFLGYSESLFRVYEHFEMVEVEGAFVYRRPKAQPTPPTARASSTWLTPIRAPVTAPSSAPAGDQAWRRFLRPALSDPHPGGGGAPRPAERIAPAPAAKSAAPAMSIAPAATEAASIAQPLPAGDRSPQARLEAAAQLMHLGDFDGALAAVLALSRDEPDDLDALLTLGNLHSLLGHYAAAREVFSQASEKEPLCVEARLFAGLAAMQAGKTQEARAELSRALFLEPTLAIGHYLLAQVEERGGAHGPARRSYRNALSQLRFPQRPLAGHYPDMPDSEAALARAARYALAALEEAS
ncbi:MAG TPA: CheR family methyltransferase [Myxococcaceae bacterium]|nr:CheR family methyltransferase [Myxococcaceae bacterium]